MNFALRLTLRCLLILLLLATTLWAALGLWYQFELRPGWRLAAVAAWSLFGLAACILVWRQRWHGLLAYTLGLAMYLSWWLNIRPGSDLLWADDVAQTLSSRVQGNQLQLQQVRAFDWRSERDYSVNWVARSYDLDQLLSVDLALSYWMGPAIAHTLVSFGFADGRYLTFSIEIRKQRHQSYSALAGFFKAYQASLIAAEESDILRTRSNARAEDVYLYRVEMSAEARRSLLLAYVSEANTWAEQPRFYNTLTANCTTVVYEMMRRISPGLPMDWRILVSGYLPEYLYDLHALPQHAPADAGFSAAIRAGIPGMAQP
jgi:hypothetical protein